MNAMGYRGYSTTVEYDDDDEIFVGRIAGINDIASFHSDTVGGLKAAFQEAVNDYIATCERVGKKAEKAYSGQLMLRVRPEVHAKVALAAQLSGKTMNEWSEGVLFAASQAAVPK